MRCTECGTEVVEEALYCDQCGTRITRKSVCDSAGPKEADVQLAGQLYGDPTLPLYDISIQQDSDRETGLVENGFLPTISIPAATPMVLPPSPPEEPALERKTIAGIAITASAVAILLLVAGLLFLRSILQ